MKTNEEKLNRHNETIKDHKAIIFCVNCGSTVIDQNFAHQLRCYDCGNTFIWDHSKFGVRRDQFKEADVISGFLNSHCTSCDNFEMSMDVFMTVLKRLESKGDQK